MDPILYEKSEPLAASDGAACGGARGQGGFVMPTDVSCADTTECQTQRVDEF